MVLPVGQALPQHELTLCICPLILGMEFRPIGILGGMFTTYQVLKSFSRHHQKLLPKNPKFELDYILDQNPYSNPFQDIIKSYSQKTPNLNWTTFQTKTLSCFLVYSDKYSMQMMQPFSKDLLRRLPRIGIWGTLWVNTKTGKGIRI